MKIDDFRYMWRGKQLEPLDEKHADMLKEITICKKNTGRALLLLHGFSSSPAVFREIVPQLPSYDAVLCPVLPGHGDSIAAFAKVSYSDWLTHSEELCEKLCKQYEKVDVMGLSLGGLLACHLSQKFKINHLYLLAPALILRVNAKATLKLAQLLKGLGFHYLRNRAGNLKSSANKELAYRQIPLSSIIEILKLIQTFTFTPPQCPVDVFLGAFDEVINSKKVAELFNKAPNAKIHWLYESAHVLPLDAELVTIVKKVAENFI